jgi:hypothetical protein
MGQSNIDLLMPNAATRSTTASLEKAGIPSWHWFLRLSRVILGDSHSGLAGLLVVVQNCGGTLERLCIGCYSVDLTCFLHHNITLQRGIVKYFSACDIQSGEQCPPFYRGSRAVLGTYLGTKNQTSELLRFCCPQ